MYRLFFICLIVVVGCTEYTPKPRGYYRLEPTQPYYIELPVHDLPYSFSVSDKVRLELTDEQQTGWITLTYPEFNATLYGSYLPVTKKNLTELIRETQTLAERMGQPINAAAYDNPESSVYGMLFDIHGDVASPIQFYLTDSLSHFFRGALYYRENPKSDSIAPVTNYLRKDMIELVQTFNWKD
jgi:hypothetical protein